jgi:stearoyl-CoA desaturase (delta-9 desaturase)
MNAPLTTSPPPGHEATTPVASDTVRAEKDYQPMLDLYGPRTAGDAASALADGHDAIDWTRCIPFFLLHVACLSVFLVGFSWIALGTAVAMYLVHMFAITGFYHRYFSHRAFKTSRVFQFVMAFVGATSVQRGPLWWAAHHRHHHNHSDEAMDTHSPRQRGFWMSHCGWFLTKGAYSTPLKYVRDWMQYPELRFINRFDFIAPVALAVGLFGLGELLHIAAPGLGTNGWQLFVWGFVFSTVVVYHATYTINSLAHRIGGQRYDTGDDSRNNFILALITLGEGWHNNHHYYPASARQGFYWWEIDLTYYGLWLLSKTGLIWNLRPVSQRALREGRSSAEARCAW